MQNDMMNNEGYEKNFNDSFGRKPSEYSFILLANEPVSGWKNATVYWGHHWTTYLYLTIIVNSAFLLWGVLNIVFICRKNSLISKPYFITLNVMVLLFALTRLVVFGTDPYGIRDIIPKTMLNILMNVCFPSLTVGFTMLYCGLKQYSRPGGILTNLLVKRYAIVIFAVICFSVSISTDITVSYAHSTELMILICQMFYVIWGITFFVIFLSILLSVNSMVRVNRKKRSKACYRKGHCLRQTNSQYLDSVPPVVIASGVCAVSFLVIAMLNLYLILAEIGLIRNSFLKNMCDSHRRLWPFFAFKSALQLCEHLMALGLVIAGTQPSKCMQLRKHTTKNSNLASTDFSTDLELASSSQTPGTSEQTKTSSLATITDEGMEVEIREISLSNNPSQGVTNTAFSEKPAESNSASPDSYSHHQVEVHAIST